MTYIDIKSSIKDVRWRLMVFCVVLMLAMDSINPVKVVCSILSISPAWMGTLSFLAIVGIMVANFNELLYFFLKVFLKSILSIFFSSIEVLGKENIPSRGPVIFTCNHMNQFVDGAVILATSPHNVGFLLAEKSLHKPVIGQLSRIAGCIPVIRPQDKAKKGAGLVQFEGNFLNGKDGASFSLLKKGDKIRPGRTPDGYRVKNVISNSRVELAADGGEALLCDEPQGEWLTYDILEHVDQNDMFSKVHLALSEGRCLGIFPEGGSHDNTHLLPLKAGIAVIAFGTLDKYDVNVSIVPVGLNYFRGHRFRGRVVVEYGTPLKITPEMMKTYKENKRNAYQDLLAHVESGMKSVIVTAHDYGELKLIHTTRRLYQRDLMTYKKQNLAKRFSLGFSLLCEKYHDANHDPVADPGHSATCSRRCIYSSLPEDIQELIGELDEYQCLLDDWGLKDYQVNSIETVNRPEMLYTFLHAFVILICASIPSIILNAPVGIAASVYARQEAKKDLAASRVKLAARDVLLSKKIVFSILAVPALLLTYGILLRLFTSWETRTIIVLMMCCPLLSYIGVISVQAGMVDLKELRPALLRLLPGFRTQAARLPAMRTHLQQEVRKLVKKYGPELGALYYDKDLDLSEYSSKLNDRISIALNNHDGKDGESMADVHDSKSTNYISPRRKVSLATAKVINDVESFDVSQLTPHAKEGDYILPFLPSMPEFEDTKNDTDNATVSDESKKTR